MAKTKKVIKMSEKEREVVEIIDNNIKITNELNQALRDLAYSQGLCESLKEKREEEKNRFEKELDWKREQTRRFDDEVRYLRHLVETLTISADKLTIIYKDQNQIERR